MTFRSGHGTHLTQVNPSVFRFLACPWVTIDTVQLQRCVGISRIHWENPRSRSKATKAIFVAFVPILD